MMVEIVYYYSWQHRKDVGQEECSAPFEISTKTIACYILILFRPLKWNTKHILQVRTKKKKILTRNIIRTITSLLIIRQK